MQENLRNRYLAQNTLPSFLEEEQGYQSIESSYINLAIVDLDAQQEREARLSSSSSSTTQEIDTELDSPEDNIDESNTINIEKVFLNNISGSSSNENDGIVGREEQSSNYQKILIHGKAGIGKTTLMKYITYQWANGRLWNQFEYVFLLPLRKLNNFQRNNVYDGLASFVYECCLSNGNTNFRINEEIEQVQNILSTNKVLLLLDGYDEFAPKKRNRDFVRPVLEAVLNHSRLSIIMTSRPNMVENRYRQLFDCQLVNIGFSNTNVTNYIENNFIGIEQEKQKLHQLIGENRTIQGMCHTPINLHLLCLVWVDLLTERQGQVKNQEFNTTSLYVGIVDWLIRRYANRVQGIALEYVRNLKHEEIELRYQATLILYERLAYEGLKQGKAVLEKGTLSKQGVDATGYRAIQEIGLLKAIDGEENFMEGNIDKEHYFIHLTFQEYMAARCIVRMLNSKNEQEVREAVEFLDNNKYAQRYERMICFIAGIVSLDKDQSPQPSQALLHFWSVVINGKVDLSIVKQLILIIKCIDESGIDGRISDIKKLKNYLKDTVLSITKTRGRRTLGKIPERIERWLGIARTNEEIDKEQEIRKLLIKLQSKDEKEKIEAIDELKQIEINELSQKDQEQVIKILLKLFKNSEDELYRKVEEGLRELTLRIKDEGLRAQVNDELMKEEIREAELIKKIEERVMSGQSSSRTGYFVKGSSRWGIDYLIKPIKNKVQLAKTLVPLLKGKNEWVCISAAETLVKINDAQVREQIVTALVPLLGSKNKSVRGSVAEVLGKINITDSKTQAQIVTVLVPLFKEDNNLYNRHSAAEILSNINITDPQVQGQLITALVPLLKDKNIEICTNAARALDKLNIFDSRIQVQLAEALVPLLKGKNEWVCSKAAKTLVKVNNAQVQEQLLTTLVSLLKGSDEYVCVRAAKTLVDINITDSQVQARVVSALTPLLKNESKYVCIEAAKTLVKINKVQVQKQLVIALVPLFKDKNSGDSVLRDAVEVLSEISMINPQIQVQMVKALIPLLKSWYQYVRSSALTVLNNINITDAQVQGQLIIALVPLLKDKNDDIRNKAVEALSRINIIDVQVQGQLVTALVLLLESWYEYVRSSALAALDKINITDPQVQRQLVTALVPLLENKDEDVRNRAVEILGKVSMINPQMQAQMMEALIPLLKNKDDSVRSNALAALDKIIITDALAQGQLVTALMFLLKSKDKYVYGSTLAALDKINITDAQVQGQLVTALVPLLKSEDKYIYGSILAALDKINITDPQVQEQLAIALVPWLEVKDENWSICIRVAEILVKINNAQVQGQLIITLVPLLKNKDEDVRNRAVEVLGKVNMTNPQMQAQMVEALILLLKNKDDSVRSNALAALDKINITDAQVQEQLVTALVPLLESKNEYICRSAVEALGKINITNPQLQTQIVTASVFLFTSESKDVRNSALAVLDKINITDPQVQGQLVTALVPLLESEDKYVYGSILAALDKINITNPQTQRELVTALESLLKDEKEYIRNRAAEALSTINITDAQVQEQLVTALVPLLESKNEYICRSAVEALGKINITNPQLQTQIVTASVFLFTSESKDVRNSALAVLDKINITDPQVQGQLVTALVPLLESKDWDVCISTAYTLGKINIADAQLQAQIVTALILLLENENKNVWCSAAQALGNIYIFYPQIQGWLVTALVPLLKDIDEDVRSSAARTLNSIYIFYPQIRIPLVTALVHILKAQHQDIYDKVKVTSILINFNITDPIIQTTLIKSVLLLFENIDIAVLTNIIKVLSSLQIDLTVNLEPLAEKLSPILMELIKDQSKSNDNQIEMLKLRIGHLLSKVQFRDLETLRNIVLSLTKQQDRLQVTTLLNLYTEQLLVGNMLIPLTRETLSLISLPLFRQAAVVVDEDKVVISYRGYQRILPFAKGEDKAEMAYQVFSYFYQQHRLSVVATELLDQKLNFSKLIQISGFDIEFDNITLAKSILQKHSYSCVNNTIRLNCQQWMISVIRKDEIVCNNARHVFMIIEGRNIFHEAELYRLELLQPNATQFPERGRIEITEEAHINVGIARELERLYQIMAGNTRYNGNNGFRADQDYYHKSCLVTREVAMQIINQAKAEKARAAEVVYDFYGIKAPNCFTWARKKLRENLEAEQYERLEIEKAGERYADPLSYLGPTANSTWAWMSHNINDASRAIGIGKVFNGSK